MPLPHSSSLSKCFSANPSSFAPDKNSLSPACIAGTRLQCLPLGGIMSNPRRQFLAQATFGLLGAAISSLDAEAQEPAKLPPGAPCAFVTGPALAPALSPTTFLDE